MGVQRGKLSPKEVDFHSVNIINLNCVKSAFFPQPSILSDNLEITAKTTETVVSASRFFSEHLVTASKKQILQS